jgi:thiol-disulfide isomerase/thioredoxin
VKTTLLIFSLAALSAVVPALFAQQPQVPRKAGDIGIQIAPEKYLWLSQYSGKTCVLAFILTSCPHCQFTTGVLDKIQKDYADKNVQILASAIEPMSAVNIPDFVKTFHPAFPVGYNEQSYVAKFLGYAPADPLLMPQLAFVDRNGIVRIQFAGDDPALKNEIQEKTLRDALEKTILEGRKK